MDVLTLRLSLEKLCFGQTARHHLNKEFMMKDCTSRLCQLQDNENLNQALAVLRRANCFGQHLCSTAPEAALSSDSSAFTIPLSSSSCQTFNHDNWRDWQSAQVLITDSLCTLDASVRPFASLSSSSLSSSSSSSSSILKEHNSSEEELSEINEISRSNRQIPAAPPGSSSSDEEIYDISDHCDQDHLRPSSTNRFCPPILSSENIEVERKLPISRINGTSLKRKAFLISSSCDPSSLVLRPNLDFEKMRKTSYLQRNSSNNNIKKPRSVRIRGLKDQVNCVKSATRKFCPSTNAFDSLTQKTDIREVLST